MFLWRWCGTLYVSVWYFEEVVCTLKMVEWYYEEGHIVLCYFNFTDNSIWNWYGGNFGGCLHIRSTFAHISMYFYYYNLNYFPTTGNVLLLKLFDYIVCIMHKMKYFKLIVFFCKIILNQYFHFFMFHMQCPVGLTAHRNLIWFLRKQWRTQCRHIYIAIVNSM